MNLHYIGPIKSTLNTTPDDGESGVLNNDEQGYEAVIERLVALYEQPFGGKKRGRYRISMKVMCRIFEQRRVWPEQREAIRRGLYERGYLLVDLETYFVVVSLQTFVSYRRVNEAGVAPASGAVPSD